jgi:hypothetical protein
MSKSISGKDAKLDKAQRNHAVVLCESLRLGVLASWREIVYPFSVYEVMGTEDYPRECVA